MRLVSMGSIVHFSKVSGSNRLVMHTDWAVLDLI